jgi:uncharacterized protein (TIGR00251 family)
MTDRNRAPIRSSDDGVVVEVWATPGASISEVTGYHDGALRIQVATPPEDGRANRAIAKLLKRTTGARKVELLRGESSRRKTFLLTGVSEVKVRSVLT